jgi:hypothetical protein
MERDDRLIQRLVDGEATIAERAELDRRALTDADLDARIRDELSLSRALDELGGLTAPFDLSADVLERIEREDAPPTWLQRIFAFRLTLPAPAWAFASLALVAAGFLLGRTGEPAAPEVASSQPVPASVAGNDEAPAPSAPGTDVAEPVKFRPAEVDRAPRPKRVFVRFVFQDEDARQVALVGDFNGWDPSAQALSPTGTDGTWTATVELTEGAHEYLFVVDGERFVSDPLADRYRDDGFGNKNALIELASSADF